MNPDTERVTSGVEPNAAVSTSHDGPKTERFGAQKLATTAAEESKQATMRLAEVLRKPSTGAAITGTLVLGAATVFGVVEATLAGGAALLAYRLLRKNQPQHGHGKEKPQ